MFLTPEVYSIVKSTRRQRYILFHVVYTEGHRPLTQTELIQAIRQQTYDLFSKHIKDLGLWVVQFDGTTGILKCKNQEKERTRELLESLKMIGSTPATITTQSTSGTIRGLTNKTSKRRK